MRLRAYAQADFEAVGAFWVEAWRATGIAVDFAERKPWLKAHLAALQEGGVDVLVAIDERDAPIALLTIDSRSGDLDQLCVAPAAQGRGLAHALIEEAKSRARGVVTLDVNVDNARALALYRREGFAEIGQGVSAAGLPTLKLRWRRRDPL